MLNSSFSSSIILSWVSPNWRRKVRSTLEPVLVSPVWQISPVCHYTDHLPCSCWGGSSLLTRHNSRPADPVHPEKTKSLLWRNFTFSSVQGQQPGGETGCRGSDRDKVHKIREIVSRNNNYKSFLPGFEACSCRTDAVWVCKLAIIFLLFQKKGSHLLGSEDNHVITIIVSTGYKSLSFILHLAVTR